MSSLRDKIRAELQRIYFSDKRINSMTEDMADAVMALIDKEKRK